MDRSSTGAMAFAASTAILLCFSECSSHAESLCSVFISLNPVRDARTGDLICDAVVTVTDGTYSERASPRVAYGTWTPDAGTPPSSCAYTAAANRPGTYAITVEKPGYKTLTLQGIQEGECSGPGDIAVELEAIN